MRLLNLRRAAVAALFFTVIASCALKKLTADRDPDGGETSSSGVGGSAPLSSSIAASSTSASSTGAGGAPPGSSASSGAGGAPAPAFSASCSGIVACPGADPCASWSYEAVDDGTATKVTGKVTLATGTMEACEASSNGPPAPVPGALTDVVDVPCAGAKWSFGLDRPTTVVYIAHDPMTGDPTLAWTPECK